MEPKLEQVVYRGPANVKSFNRGLRVVAFEKDVPVEVDSDFASELLANTEGHLFERASAARRTFAVEGVSA